MPHQFAVFSYERQRSRTWAQPIMRWALSLVSDLNLTGGNRA